MLLCHVCSCPWDNVFAREQILCISIFIRVINSVLRWIAVCTWTFYLHWIIIKSPRIRQILFNWYFHNSLPYVALTFQDWFESPCVISLLLFVDMVRIIGSVLLPLIFSLISWLVTMVLILINVFVINFKTRIIVFFLFLIILDFDS